MLRYVDGLGKASSTLDHEWLRVQLIDQRSCPPSNPGIHPVYEILATPALESGLRERGSAEVPRLVIFDRAARSVRK